LARPVSRRERLLKWVRRSPFQATALVATGAFVLALFAALFAGMQSARRGEALLEREAELQRRTVEEQGKELSARQRFTRLYTAAEEAARAAAWEKAEQAAQSALDLQADNPTTFTDFPLLEPTRQLLARARGKLASEQERQEHRSRLPRAKEYLGDAVFF